MSVKRFVAADMRRALELVRIEMGEEAIILSSKRVKGGVEVLTSNDAYYQNVAKPEPKVVPTATRSSLQQTDAHFSAEDEYFNVDMPMSSDVAWGQESVMARLMAKQTEDARETRSAGLADSRSEGQRNNARIPSAQQAPSAKAVRTRQAESPIVDDSTIEDFLAENSVVNFRQALREQHNQQFGSSQQLGSHQLDSQQRHSQQRDAQQRAFPQVASAKDGSPKAAISNNNSQQLGQKNPAGKQDSFALSAQARERQQAENRAAASAYSALGKKTESPVAKKSSLQTDFRPTVKYAQTNMPVAVKRDERAAPSISARVGGADDNAWLTQTEYFTDGANESGYASSSLNQASSSFNQASHQQDSYKKGFLRDEVDRNYNDGVNTKSEFPLSRNEAPIDVEHKVVVESTKDKSTEVISAAASLSLGSFQYEPGAANISFYRDPNSYVPPAANQSRKEESEKAKGPSLDDLFDEQFSELKTEIMDMRELLQSQLSLQNQLSELAKKTAEEAAEKKARIVGNTVKTTITRRLKQLGLPETEIDKCLTAFTPDKNLSIAWSECLASISHRLPVIGKDIVDAGGCFAFVGPSGAGKTATVAKLASRFVLKHGAKGVALVTTGEQQASGNQQLQRLASILNIELHRTSETNSLEQVLDNLRNYKLVLVDTTGVRSDDVGLRAQLRDLRRFPQLKSFLVLSANTQIQALKSAVINYKAANLFGCILTKLDETASLGEVLAVVINAKLPIAYSSHGQAMPKDIQTARAHQLVTKAIALLKAGSQQILKRKQQIRSKSTEINQNVSYQAVSAK